MNIIVVYIIQVDCCGCLDDAFLVVVLGLLFFPFVFNITPFIRTGIGYLYCFVLSATSPRASGEHATFLFDLFFISFIISIFLSMNARTCMFVPANSVR